MTNAVNIAQGGSNNVTFRNKIINGACVIDQRNAGASVTPIGSSGFAVDRWQYFTNATAGAFNAGQNLNSVTPPSGFTKYLGYQVASAQTPTGTNAYFFGQKIEGFNVADLGWGASGAQPISISFWVRSSLTGTHSGNVQNTSNARSYVFSYSINSANTWEYKTISVAGDTTGTWPTDNTTGLIIYFNLGCGTGIQTTAGSWNAAQYIGVTGGVSVVSNASATWYITGVQLEAGTTASPFEYRQYGTELALCQRYASSTFPQGTAWAQNAGRNGAVSLMSQSTSARQLGYFTFPVTMRTNPTLTSYSPFAATSAWWNDTNSAAEGAATFTASIGDRGQGIFTTNVASGVSQVFLIHVSASAEL